MVDNFDNQDEIMIGNRRLRKIKRPKQYVAPISEPASQTDYRSDINNLPYVQEDQMYDNRQAYAQDDSFAYQNNMAYAYDAVEKKKVFIIAVICLLVGIFAGKLLFSSSKVVQNGLQGIVMNPEVPQGRSRCGVAEKTQGCVLYIMNPQRQELNGRDFYDLASQLTGRQRFVIETGNMRYSSMKIKPGFIAQLNIPPLN
ncbi:MAG: hypothetical protein J6W11_03840 [Alphaproteobacteria bacterium]|nr:hypothetical protein [Alphaproteobacteria bacterium]MBO7097751.1 hypothetical protein [Alphaproteobacteria bacterium]